MKMSVGHVSNLFLFVRFANNGRKLFISSFYFCELIYAFDCSLVRTTKSKTRALGRYELVVCNVLCGRH